jgi:glycogen operon protein
VGDSWQEWNGKFRDDVRSFFRGEEGSVTQFADRMLGSPDIYSGKQRNAEQSVNFVTCHDGFTLNDLVSYNEKHNAANGEDNHDGASDNRSWNCGVEGETDDAAVERLRNRQVRNFLTSTMLSFGVPMIVMGDEVRRTQRGNNNAYCQDSETSWFDWTLLEKHADLHRFASLLIGRRLLRSLNAEQHRESLSQLLRDSKRTSHGVTLNEPDWSQSSHSFAVAIEPAHEDRLFYFIFNAYWNPLAFQLPRLDSIYGPVWRRWIDTSLEPPDDIVPWQTAPAVTSATYAAEARSTVVLFADLIGMHSPAD